MKTGSPPPADRPAGGPPAVIVGLDCITGLQSARILAARGVRVVGVAERRDHFCCRTRAVDRVVRAETRGPGLVGALERLAPELGGRAVLIPCTDLAVLAISADRDRLLGAGYALRLPDHDVVELLMDKERFVAYAQDRGLPVPGTRIVHERAQIEVAARELAFPVVLKPRLKTSEWQRNTKAKAFKAADATELLAIYDRAAAWTDSLLVQEWIEGGEDSLYSCNTYHDEASRPVATFVARKIRQWPPQTGTSSLGEECRNDEVLHATLDLFASVSYRGLGYVEMKRDVRTGWHAIIEPNVGRPTGRSAIAEAGGVELLYAAYADMAGLPLPADLEQRYGDAKWIYLRHDLQSALHYWRRGELSIGDWWRSIRGPKTEAVLSFHDPLPFVGDLANVAGTAMRSFAGR